MPPYSFHYFNVRGLGEMVRYTMNDLGLDFEDALYNKDTWAAFKPKTDFGQLPLLRDGDLQLVQSGAIMRHLARKHDLFGDSDSERALIDMMFECQLDIRKKYGAMVYQNYEAGKQPFIDELPDNLVRLEALLKRNNDGKSFFVGNKISYADYAIFDLLDNLTILQSTCLDAFPALKSFHMRISGRPALAKYRETDTFKERNVNGNGKQ